VGSGGGGATARVAQRRRREQRRGEAERRQSGRLRLSGQEVLEKKNFRKIASVGVEYQ